MKISALQNKEEYDTATARIYHLIQIGVPSGSKEDQELRQLARMVEAYEDKHHSIPLPDSSEATKFRRKQMRSVK